MSVILIHFRGNEIKQEIYLETALGKFIAKEEQNHSINKNPCQKKISTN